MHTSIYHSKMSLRSIYSDICGKINETKNITSKFSALRTDEERFALVYELCEGYLSKINLESYSKEAYKSERARKIGNEKLYKDSLWEALELYNESIALAPNKSEELAFSFGNRAVCLLKLGFSKEALEDVERALTLPVTNNFRDKLLLRKEKCLNTMNAKFEHKCIFGFGDLVALEGGKSLFFDSASHLLSLISDENFERQLIANENIYTGQVLIVEKPFSSVLLPASFYTHCSYCFKRCLTLIPCPGCPQVMFCGEECRISSFNKHHKIECSILGGLVKLKADRMDLLALRLLIDASQQGEHLEKLYLQISEHNVNKCSSNQNKCYNSFEFMNIYNLVTNTDKRSIPDLFYRAVVSVIMIFFLEKFTNFFKHSSEGKKGLKDFSGGLVLRFMQSLPCNAHEISEFCENGLNEIGGGAYATLSLINHSCDPNVVRLSCKDVIILRSIRPIKKGDQIFDNYGYHYATHSLAERQNALMKQYYFKCKCQACLELWPKYEDLPHEQLILKKEIDMKIYEELTEKFEKTLEMIFKGSFDLETISENTKYLDYLDENVKRPWKTYNKCQEAIKHCLSFLGNHYRFSKGV